MPPIRDRQVPMLRGPVSDALDALMAAPGKSTAERLQGAAELKASLMADTADSFTVTVNGHLYTVTDIHFDPQLRAVSVTVDGPGITEIHNPFWFYNPPHAVIGVAADGSRVLKEDLAGSLRRIVADSILMNVKV